jgi:4-azaleucine resistance transporter AzlC
MNVSSFWRTADRGTRRDIALVCLADAIVGASFGALTVSGGLAPWVPIAMSVLVFAGGAQFAAVGVVLAGGSPVAAVAAGALLNTRLFPYGLAIADVTSFPGARWWTRFLGAHVVTDESVAFALRATGPARRRAGFWLCGVALFAVWNVAVVLGVLAGGVVKNTGAFGLDAAFPAVLLALAMPALADRRTRMAAVCGGTAAVALTPFLPAGLPVLAGLAGLAAGWRRRRRAGTSSAPSRVSSAAASDSGVSGSGVSG